MECIRSVGMGVGVGEHQSEDSFVCFGAKPTQRACAQDFLRDRKKTRKGKVLYNHIHIHNTYTSIHGKIFKHNDERTLFFRKIYLTHFILERVAKGLMLVVSERWVGDGTDCHILTPSSSDYSSTSSSFCWAAQPGSWGPKPSVWRRFSLRHLLSVTPLTTYWQRILWKWFHHTFLFVYIFLRQGSKWSFHSKSWRHITHTHTHTHIYNY